MNEWLDADKIIELSQHYKALGPLIGILLPFIEAFLPFLPLVVFIIANAGAYGLWLGFILSWVGTVAGSYVVFLVIRKYGRNRILLFLTKKKRVQQLISWVERNGLDRSSFSSVFLSLLQPLLILWRAYQI